MYIPPVLVAKAAEAVLGKKAANDLANAGCLAGLFILALVAIFIGCVVSSANHEQEKANLAWIKSQEVSTPELLRRQAEQKQAEIDKSLIEESLLLAKNFPDCTGDGFGGNCPDFRQRAIDTCNNFNSRNPGWAIPTAQCSIAKDLASLSQHEALGIKSDWCAIQPLSQKPVSCGSIQARYYKLRQACDKPDEGGPTDCQRILGHYSY